MTDARLYSPVFWQDALRDVPPLHDEALERMLAALAVRHDVTIEYVHARLTDYLRGSMAEREPAAHRGSNTIN